MTVTDFILKNKQIIITETGNDAEFQPDNSALLFGEVVAVNDLTEFYTVGDRIYFDAGDSRKFLLNDVLYYLTTEDKVYLTYPYVAP
jgi:hypothetical protein